MREKLSNHYPLPNNEVDFVCPFLIEWILPEPVIEKKIQPQPIETNWKIQRQDICEDCQEFNMTRNACTIEGKTCGSCYRNNKINRCPKGKW